MNTLHLGDIRIDRLVETEGPFADANFLLPEIDAGLLKANADWLYPRFVEPVTNNCLLYTSPSPRDRG